MDALPPNLAATAASAIVRKAEQQAEERVKLRFLEEKKRQAAEMRAAEARKRQAGSHGRK